MAIRGIPMMTRRDAIRLAVSMPLAPWTAAAQSASTPALASGDPMSPQRRALIDAFRGKIAGVADQFEKRVHKSSWAMPYRLFRPSRAAGAPLVLYLHGSGGLGCDRAINGWRGHVEPHHSSSAGICRGGDLLRKHDPRRRDTRGSHATMELPRRRRPDRPGGCIARPHRGFA